MEIQKLYVTVQERAVAEDIKNATKDEILKRIGDKLQQIFDEEVREPLSNKLGYFKAHPSKAKKEALLVLYNDITEELQHLEAVDEHFFWKMMKMERLTDVNIVFYEVEKLF